MPKTKVCLGCGDLAEDGGIFCSRCREVTQGGLAKRVMIFTSDPEIIMEVKEQFIPQGCSVVGERDLDKGTMMLRKDVPHLVILDTETAATIGYELAREIKESQFHIHLIIISNTEKSRKLFQDLGVDYFFLKPMDKKDFMVAVAKILTSKN